MMPARTKHTAKAKEFSLENPGFSHRCASVIENDWNFSCRAANQQMKSNDGNTVPQRMKASHIKGIQKSHSSRSPSLLYDNNGITMHHPYHPLRLPSISEVEQGAVCPVCSTRQALLFPAQCMVHLLWHQVLCKSSYSRAGFQSWYASPCACTALEIGSPRRPWHQTQPLQRTSSRAHPANETDQVANTPPVQQDHFRTHSQPSLQNTPILNHFGTHFYPSLQNTSSLEPSKAHSTLLAIIYCTCYY